MTFILQNKSFKKIIIVAIIADLKGDNDVNNVEGHVKLSIIVLQRQSWCGGTDRVNQQFVYRLRAGMVDRLTQRVTPEICPQLRADSSFSVVDNFNQKIPEMMQTMPNKAVGDDVDDVDGGLVDWWSKEILFYDQCSVISLTVVIQMIIP